MRRLLVLLTLIGTTLALSAGAAFAEADSETFTSTEKQLVITDNPCNGDVVLVTATTTEVFHFTDNQRTEVSIHHINIAGTGLFTGNEYAFNQIQNTFTVTPVGTTQTFTGHLNLIGQGQVPDFRVRVVIHVTINANGEATSEVSFLDAECTG